MLMADVQILERLKDVFAGQWPKSVLGNEGFADITPGWEHAPQFLKTKWKNE